MKKDLTTLKDGDFVVVTKNIGTKNKKNQITRGCYEVKSSDDDFLTLHKDKIADSVHLIPQWVAVDCVEIYDEKNSV